MESITCVLVLRECVDDVEDTASDEGYSGAPNQAR